MLFADRGHLSNTETLTRLGVTPEELPLDYVSADAVGLDAVQEIAALIEGHDLPEVVFVEAADSLVKDGNKPQDVVPFLKGLQSVAEYYHCAIILSVGAPKSRNGEKHTAQRDRIIGSEKWGRHAEDVLTLEFVSGGTEHNGTDDTRTLTVQHRNAPAESFALVFAKDGEELVEDTRVKQDDPRVTWMRTAGRFSKYRLRTECNVSGATADKIIAAHRANLKRHKDDSYTWRQAA